MAASASSLTVYCIRVLPGEELASKLLDYVEKHNLRAAFVMTCCGSVTKATLRYAQKADGVNVREPDPSKCKHEMDIETLEGHFEIVSLVGTLNQGGHLHISLADENGRVIGGHVIGDLNVFTTAEVVIGECDYLKFQREMDNKTGFPELEITPR